MIVSVVWLPACGGNNKKPASKKKATAPVVEKKVVPEKPISVIIQTIPKVQYQHTDKRNPFAGAAQNVKKVTTGIAADFSTESLRLTGTVIQPTKKWAFIVTPDGKIYKITEGTSVGNRGAIVSEITENRVVLTEMMGAEQRIITLTVSEPQK
ncbi:MAG: hypothetical protein A3F17_09070 [Gammaproteobacteria bacterium RIFCSPHIGHO2_12_FULL_41_15]|nr:MAG: hypothetical protein A3F17_09070 [Gammaproteobacteria bacterium RIFCSPHIGHO2_12_FULL_41_15]